MRDRWVWCESGSGMGVTSVVAEAATQLDEICGPSQHPRIPIDVILAQRHACRHPALQTILSKDSSTTIFAFGHSYYTWIPFNCIHRVLRYLPIAPPRYNVVSTAAMLY